MNPKQIEKNLKTLRERDGVNADKVVLLAKFKRGEGDSRKALVERIARHRAENIRVVEALTKGWVPGVVFEAVAVGQFSMKYPMRAGMDDEVLTDGERYFATGDTIEWGLHMVNWPSVVVLDENLEAMGPPTEAALFEAVGSDAARRTVEETLRGYLTVEERVRPKVRLF